jgi:FtsZ-binding cell division protein ZapB
MGKKKEKVVDLKPEAISEEQLKEVQQVVSTINKLQFEVGSLEVQKQGILRGVFQGNEKLQELRESLSAQYGTADVNIQDGTINYKEDEPSDS